MSDITYKTDVEVMRERARQHIDEGAVQNQHAAEGAIAFPPYGAARALITGGSYSARAVT
ncbi:MAG TPA: hypothetical protein VM532_09700 [Burkholderiales bacterium]|jgi:hypothetical protein|nr:hypothetical protein [Burkholderiales bacterium]